jgi:Golgi phosphoprotein 3 (GPP34)
MSDQNGRPPSSAGRTLYQALRALYLEAGEPSSRELARMCGRGTISHNTVNQILRGLRLPRQGQLEVLVNAMDGDWPAFKALWCEARREADPDPGPQASLFVADELFLVGLDPHTGRWRITRDVLSIALAGAALGDLVLAGRAVLEGGRVRATTLGDDDPVAGYVLAELAGRDGTGTLPDWVWHLRPQIGPLVGQRLAAAGVVTTRLTRRTFALRPSVEYRAVDLVVAGRPVVRLGGYLLRQTRPSDVHSRLLAALVCAVGLESRLPIDLPVPEIRRRLAAMGTGLPSGLAAVVGAVVTVRDALGEAPV